MRDITINGLVLVYGAVCVDANKLHSGIYQTSHPSILPPGTTLDSLATRYIKYAGFDESSEFIKNLRRCELKEATLTVKNDQDGK